MNTKMIVGMIVLLLIIGAAAWWMMDETPSAPSPAAGNNQDASLADVEKDLEAAALPDPGADFKSIDEDLKNL